jgi:hypothetical protein
MSKTSIPTVGCSMIRKEGICIQKVFPLVEKISFWLPCIYVQQNSETKNLMCKCK